MSTTEITKALNEYRSVPLAQLVESSTNPRKAFDEERLEELAESVRSKGILLPLVVRPVNGHYEIVAGARRFRAAQRAGLDAVPVHVSALTDAEAQEVQIIENLLRTDLHPFEEARGFRALLDREGSQYTVETIAAKTGKNAAFITKRLKLLDLTQPVADVFLAGRIGIEHALLIAKLAPDVQEQALAHCFDGYGAGNEADRSLVPASRLQTWIARNIYLSLKSVPFSKDDETLLPEAGSCANCPKRTGFNTLLFDGHPEDACVDAGCFNRKLDMHITRRMEKMPGLVLISEQHALPEGTPILPRHKYVEVVARKARGRQEARPEQRVCNHTKAAIHADGMDKGRLVKVCAERSCKIHFRDEQEQEKQRLAWKAQRAEESRKTKQTTAFRHRLLSETLKRVKPELGNDHMRIVARFVLQSLPHELALRLAKRHALQPAKDQNDWQLAEKARALHKGADAAELARLIFEAILLGSAASQPPDTKDDLLADAAALFKVDAKAIRKSVQKEEQERTEKKSKTKKNK